MTIDPFSALLFGSSWSWKPHVRAVFRFSVWRLWPGTRNPAALIGGQSVCSGCGSEATLWLRVSLLTNCTWLPRGTVTLFGLTPLVVIVKVAAAVCDGVVPESEPL